MTFVSYGTPPPDALIILMDDTCRGQLHQPVQGAWDRNLHRRVVEKLLVAGARKLCSMLLTSRPQRKLINNCCNHQNECHAGRRFESPATEPVSFRTGAPPAEPLDTAAAWGIVGPKDEDGVLRRRTPSGSPTLPASGGSSGRSWTAADRAGSIIMDRLARSRTGAFATPSVGLRQKWLRTRLSSSARPPPSPTRAVTAMMNFRLPTLVGQTQNPPGSKSRPPPP